MTINAVPYLGFRGEAREALNFYKSVFGGTLELLDYPDPDAPLTASGDKPVMHGFLKTDAGWEIMGADNLELAAEDSAAQRMNVVVFGDDVELMKEQFDKLSEGASVHMPLEMQMWGDMFGGLKDQYGIDWGFNVEVSKQDQQ